MANRFYDNTFVAIPSTVIRSQGDITQFESVEAGLDAVQIELDAALRAPNGEVIGRIPALADRASKSLAFDPSGNPIAVISATSAEMEGAVIAAQAAEDAAAEASADAASLAGSAALINLHLLNIGII
jgi:hypothetical protein